MTHSSLLRSLLLIFLLGSSLHAKSQWEFIGSPESCESVDVDSEGDTLLVLTSGGLFYSTDEANSWNKISIPLETVELVDIQIEEGSLYLTSMRGILIGTIDRIAYDVYRSDDWGLNWHLLTADMHPLAFFIQVLVKSDTFYFIDNYAIHISYDKGDHYDSVVFHLGFYSFYYIHNHKLFGEVAWEENNALLRSDDDGHTWDTLYVAGDIHFISGVNSIDGALWMIEHIPNGHLCRVRKSFDDGQSWIVTGHIEDLLSGFFDYDPEQIIGSEGRLYVTADRSSSTKRIYYSEDGGITWTLSTTIQNEVYYGLGKLFYTGTDFYASEDHGVTWEKKIRGIEAATAKNIALSDSSLWVKGGRHVYSFNPEMDSWQELLNFNQVESTRDGHLLALINYQAHTSSNAGLDWIPVTEDDLGQDFPFSIFQIMCAGDNMYIVGSSGKMYYSIDFGNSWHLSDLSYAYLLSYNDQYLFEVDGKILISENGIDWNEIPKPEHPDLSVFTDFIYRLEPYYYIGNKDLLLRLHQDSTSWEEIEDPVSPGVYVDMSMISHKDVLFVTVYGLGVYASIDYGDSWYSVNEGLDNFKSLTLTKDEDYLYLGVEGGVWKRRLSDMIVAITDPRPNVDEYSTTIIANDIITFDSPEGLQGDYSVQVYSGDGRNLFQTRVTDSSIDIDLDHFPAGMYYVNIVSQGYHKVKRFIKF